MCSTAGALPGLECVSAKISKLSAVMKNHMQRTMCSTAGALSRQECAHGKVYVDLLENVAMVFEVSQGLDIGASDVP